jgi:hypothetical protein
MIKPLVHACDPRRTDDIVAIAERELLRLRGCRSAVPTEPTPTPVRCGEEPDLGMRSRVRPNDVWCGVTGPIVNDDDLPRTRKRLSKQRV